MKKLHVRITFTDPVLGTGNSNKEIHSEFIASKAPDAMSREEEIAAIGLKRSRLNPQRFLPDILRRVARCSGTIRSRDFSKKPARCSSA